MASEHRVSIKWQRATPDFEYKTYGRNHTWDFGHGVVVPASAAPKYFGDDTRVDPEQAFVASLSSCHMLTFLALAARKKIAVNRYEDNVVGILDFNQNKKLAITEVTLKPQIEFDPATQPDAETLQQLHHHAHEECFIANSVTTKVKVEY